MKVKNKFEMPKVKVILFDDKDILTTSGKGDPNELPGVNPFAFFGDEK